MEIKVNGKSVEVDCVKDVGKISLNTFLRTHLNLKGTKSCPKDACSGGCIVHLRRPHPVTHEWEELSVNACRFPLLTCADCEVETIEWLRFDNFIVQRLAALGANQCGNCPPGLLISLHTLLSKRGAEGVQMKDLEDFSCGSCDCALEVVKSFLFEKCDEKVNSVILGGEKHLINPYMNYKEKRMNNVLKYFKMCDNNCEFYRVTTLEELFDVIKERAYANYCLIAGNTQQGTYIQSVNSKVLIDINYVKELRGHEVLEDGMKIGGGCTISEVIGELEQLKSEEGFGYFKELIRLLTKIGTKAIRDVGTVAGNLMIKHVNPEFYSDIFVLLSTLDSRITVARGYTDDVSLLPDQFLHHDMEHCVIKNITFPKLSCKSHFLRSYKTSNGGPNGELFASATFLFKFASEGEDVNFKKLEFASISYGGINPKFTRARKVEAVLEGKNIFDAKVFQLSLQKLTKYLKPDSSLSKTSPEFRKQLAINLFYKSVISICPHHINPEIVRFKSTRKDRSLPQTTRKYYSMEKLFPFTQPMMPIDALSKLTGDIGHVDDLLQHPEDLYCCFVTAKKINHRFIAAYPEEVLKIDGVVAFFDATHIPGKNSYVSLSVPLISEEEKLFLRPRARIQYHNQPVGMIIATSQELARRVADLVEIKYGEIEDAPTELLDLDKIMESNDRDRMTVVKRAVDDIEPRAGTAILSSGYALSGQFHNPSGNFITICSPMSNNGIMVQTSTPCRKAIQTVLGELLSMPNSRFKIESLPPADPGTHHLFPGALYISACALASHFLKSRVKFVVSPEDAIKIVGKKMGGMRSFYRVQVSEKGQILHLFSDVYTDCGSSTNRIQPLKPQVAFQSCYNGDNYNLKLTAIRTDTSSNACPSYDFEPLCMIENIMEHVAYSCRLDPVEVRMINMHEKSPAKDIYQTLIETGNYHKRKKEIDEFNRNNRWKKRGISSMPLTSLIVPNGDQEAVVRISPSDGSVTVAHGGFEYGQGINTKVAQMAAHILGVPMEIITVTDDVQCDHGSEPQVISAVRKSCESLNARLIPIKDLLPGVKWPTLAQAAHEHGIDLTHRHFLPRKDFPEHSIHAACLTEIVLDVLTGSVTIQRVDILQDVGLSINPLIDIGQIQSSFVNSMGYWLTGGPTTDPQTGEVISRGPLNSPSPPIDFRVELLKNEDVFSAPKAVGDFSAALSWTIQPAIRSALNAARSDAGLKEAFLPLPSSCSPANLLLLTGTDNSQLSLRGE